jgi:hypothetical protein
MARVFKFDKAIYVLACWGLFGLMAIGLYQVLARTSFPAPIVVYRDGKVHEYSWQVFIGMLGVIAGSLWLALTTKVGERTGPTDYAYMLRRQAKITGWMIAIGGVLGEIHLLMILLGRMQP